MVHINRLTPIYNIRKPKSGDGKRQEKNRKDETKSSDNPNETTEKNPKNIIDERV